MVAVHRADTAATADTDTAATADTGATRRGRGVIRGRTGLAAAVAAFALSATLAALNKLVLNRSPFGDLRIYRLEGSAVRHGADLYGHLPGVEGLATYPPFAGLTFVPMTILPLGVLEVVNLLLTVAAVGWICTAMGRLCGAGRERAATVGLAVAAIGLWCEPVLMTLHYGQINVFLAALVLWDFTRRPGSRVAGLGIGLAAAIKLTPAIFVVYLLLTRRWAMAARAAVTFAVALLASLLVDAHATVGFWTDHVFETGRVGRLENEVNQTVQGWLARAHHSRDLPRAELLIVAAVAVLGLVAAVRAYRSSGDRRGVPATAVTGLLCSPISWDHHWVWCLPIIVLLCFERSRWLLLAALAVFFSFCLWWVPHGDPDSPVELSMTWWQVLISSWYVVFGLAFLLVTLRRSSGTRT